ncbi:MAG TPA: tRNA preQ1(34) S-adenosylmethionine ribosyltransferase-isomerase QueA [Candidatus Dormibacteraeota bacterium]|nr:tRNA preQ1(34) S-adenosylmethionine ribosyltransferase-isomerase QueA [Candidatus Dormibacteraeota bacterium]
MSATGAVGGGVLSDFDYGLPPELIAQHPPNKRGDSRLLHLPADGPAHHLHFRDLPDLLRAGDLLVMNDTRVIPARIRFEHRGRDAEILLLERAGNPDTWDALLRPAKRFVPGVRVQLRFGLWADVLQQEPGGERRLRFSPPGRLGQLLPQIGEMPLPPYIHERLDDPERYQTVVARDPGSAAAPTAGLHFTEEMLTTLTAAGLARTELTLSVGLDTFQPVRAADLDDHRMHSEAYTVSPRARAEIDACRARGGRLVAVGTTVARALEAAAVKRESGDPRPDAGRTDIFIRPGHAFREVDLLLTNFHLPKSTLLVLVSAFSGRERILAAYEDAVRRRYRFFSFGDAMLLEPAVSMRRG